MAEVYPYVAYTGPMMAGRPPGYNCGWANLFSTSAVFRASLAFLSLRVRLLSQGIMSDASAFL